MMWGTFGILLLQTMGESNQASSDVLSQPPIPRSSPGSWIQTQDYPGASLAQNEEGTVAFEVLVGVDGKVQNCSIQSSSGSATLDEATCRIIQSRGLFYPARDQEGRPVEARYGNTVLWVIPYDQVVMPTTSIPTPEPFMLEFRVTINSDGEITSCTQNSEGMVPDENRQPEFCNYYEASGITFEPFTDEDGNQVGRTVVFHTSMRIE